MEQVGQSDQGSPWGVERDDRDEEAMISGGTVLVSTDYRFQTDSSGQVVASRHYGYDFWTRYLDVFSSVIVLGRIAGYKPDHDCTALQVVGPGVRMAGLPDTQSAAQFITRLPSIRRATRSAVRDANCAVLRLPNFSGLFVAGMMSQDGKPYVVELCGDVRESLQSLYGGLRGAPMRLLGGFEGWRLKRVIEKALGIAYVTESRLQASYPASVGQVTASYSSVDLPKAAYCSRSGSYRTEGNASAAWRILFAGSLERRYKGMEFLLEAIAWLLKDGLNCELTVLGDGKLRSEYERLAVTLNISEAVDFRGAVSSGEPVWLEMRQHDLLVLPSLTEGLSRVVIEAMANSLPVIATQVGGTVELVNQSELVEPSNSTQLANAISSLLRDNHRRASISNQNYERALKYQRLALVERRTAFYRTLVEPHCPDTIERKSKQ